MKNLNELLVNIIIITLSFPVCYCISLFAICLTRECIDRFLL